MRSSEPDRSLAEVTAEQTEATLQRFYGGLDWSPVVRSALRHAFDQLLQDAVPAPMHIEARKRAHDIIAAELSRAPIMLRDGGDSEVDLVEAHCTVQMYGSCVANFDAPESDLDLSVDGYFAKHLEYIDMLDAPKEWTDALLEHVAAAVTPVAVAGSVVLVPAARVPVVRFVERKTGVDCDICIGNRDAVFKSRALRELSRVDHRFPDLVRMVKAWARRHGINDAGAGTLNSHALTLMALFHLQRVHPPVMPPLATLFDGDRPLRVGADAPLDAALDAFAARCADLGASGYGLANTETTAELFLGMLARFMAVTQAWASGAAPGVRVSTWHGMLCDGFWEHNYVFLMEDPFLAADNAARAVGVRRKPSDALGDIVWAFRDGARAAYRVRSKACVTDLMRELFGGWAARSVDLDGMLLDGIDMYAPLPEAAPVRPPPPAQPLPPPPRRRGAKGKRARALEQFGEVGAGADAVEVRALQQGAADLASQPVAARGAQGKQLRGLHDALAHLKKGAPAQAAVVREGVLPVPRGSWSGNAARPAPGAPRKHGRRAVPGAVSAQRRGRQQRGGGKRQARFGFSSAVDPGGGAASDGAGNGGEDAYGLLHGAGGLQGRHSGGATQQSHVDNHVGHDDCNAYEDGDDSPVAMLPVGGVLGGSTLRSSTVTCCAQLRGSSLRRAGTGCCRTATFSVPSALILSRCAAKLHVGAARGRQKSARRFSRAGAVLY